MAGGHCSWLWGTFQAATGGGGGLPLRTMHLVVVSARNLLQEAPRAATPPKTPLLSALCWLLTRVASRGSLEMPEGSDLFACALEFLVLALVA